MTSEVYRLFLKNYLSSLSEETQETINGRRFGFDHVIEQLGAAKGWIVHRTPSHAPVDGGLPTPKKEPEHGIDYAFFSADRTLLYVFVLKDEPLTYKQFRSEKFDQDITSAARHDPTAPEFASVRKVQVVLAYNKSEEEEGVEEFTKLTKSLGTKVGDHISLEFDRWNLERLVSEVEAHLLSPALLPANFFRALTYICWQVGDFSHGSSQWEEVLVPDWKEFLEDLLADKVTPRSVWMVAVALPIVRQHGKAEPSFETGWLDLVEWAMLALWQAVKRSNDKVVRAAVVQVWLDSYVQELELFYLKHGDSLGREHALNPACHYSFQAVTESYLAFWHLGRLGILWVSLVSVAWPDDPKTKQAFGDHFGRIGGWMVGLMRASPGARRPVLDIHHVEYFLYWQMLFRTEEKEEIGTWLHSIYEGLRFRRIRDHDPLRVISTDNDWESVFEFIVSGIPPSEGYGRTSYLMLMLLELGFCLEPSLRDPFLNALYDHVVIAGSSRKRKQKSEPEPIELAGWAPPANWDDLAIGEGLDQAEDTGVAIMTHNFVEGPHDPRKPLAERIERFVTETRQAHPFEVNGELPFAILALGCIKTRTPLPSEFWRQFVFPAGPGAGSDAEPKPKNEPS